MSFAIVSKNFIIISTVLFLWYGKACGQYNVIGAVHDDKNLPVPYTKVSLIKASDSSILTSDMTSLDGKYRLLIDKKGEYIVSIISKLYKRVDVPCSVRELNTSIPPITLLGDIVNLREVRVSAQKPVYEQQIDRIVVNIGGQNTLVSGSVLEVLEKLPGIKVDRQTSSISLNGKDEVGIMLGGKIINVPLSSLMQMLNTMEAGNIKQVELITNPPAKYDVGNAGGLINIIMNKRISDGSNGSYTVGFGYGDFDKEKLAANWNTRKGKLNVFGDFSYNRDHSYRKFGNYKTIEAIDDRFSTNTISSRFPISINYSGRVGFDYDLSSKVVVGGTIYGLINTWNQKVNSTGNIFIQPDSAFSLGILNSENSSKTLITNNLNLSYKINKISNLDFDLDYLYFYNKNPNFYENNYYDDSHKLVRNDVFSSVKRTPVNIWAGRVDYGVTMNKIRLEIGYKTTLTSLDNLVNFKRTSGSDNGADLNSASDSNLNETIHAFYISSKWTIDKTTNLNTGIRYEDSDTKLSVLEQNQIVNRSIAKVFPTIFLSKTIGNSMLQLSYGKRINRPTYNDLAPFILFLDPTTLYNGNIALLPSVSNVYTLGYSYKKYSLASEFTNIANPIFRYQPVLSENKTQVFMPVNLKRNKIYSIILSIPVKLFDWWELDNSIQGVTQSIELMSGDLLPNSYFRIKSTHSFMLPKQYSIQLFASYQSARLTGISRTSPSNKIDLAIDKKWLGTNDRLQLSISNLLLDRYHVTSINEENPNFSALTDYRYESRVIRLTYTHLFGNTKVKAQRRVIKAIDDIEERVIK